MNRARVAAGKNIRTAAAAWLNQHLLACLGRERVATVVDMKTRPSIQVAVGGILLVFLQGCGWWSRPSPPSLVGNWTNPIGTVWMIKSDGTFDVDLMKDGQRDAWGKYTVDADTVTLVAVGGVNPRGCDGAGIYRFKRTGDQLRFTLVSDSCQLRKRNILLLWRLKK